MIPAALAEKCRDTFRVAVKALLADSAANDADAARSARSAKVTGRRKPTAAQRRAPMVERVYGAAKSGALPNNQDEGTHDA